jgi:glycosyltransferase involved in cell wall biosynthesis
MSNSRKISIVIPARNEEAGLSRLLPNLKSTFPQAEILIVDDGSTDRTPEIARQHDTQLVQHPRSMGNGAAIKSGARVATGDILIFMDSDGQHQPEDIVHLMAALDEGYDMAVGARTRNSQAGAHRAIANGFYNRVASWMVGHKVEDLTSGFRAVRAEKFRKFLYLLPNGFSYPTTITMCFFRAGHPIKYIPIHAPKRMGKSHLRILRDGLRFLLIIFRIATLYSPLKLFAPVSGLFFLTGISYYFYTYIEYHRFTNMSALLFITSVLVLLIGLISEQITMLNYRDSEK